MLDLPHLRAQLTQAAPSETLVGGIDAVLLNCRVNSKSLPTQDRYCAAEWVFINRDGTWKFILVLNGEHHTRLICAQKTFRLRGHGGSAAVDFVADRVPSMLRAALGAAVDQSHPDLTDNAIGKIVDSVFADIQNRLMTDFLALIPAASGQTHSDMAAYFRDASGELLPAVQRVLSGTTVSLALVDPSSRVHVFSIGDCDASKPHSPR
uniref:Serine/threonine protein phosphatase 2C n=1 Tax=Mycena chlorophos TaxID=658473 RepID=A0ABQ0MCI5_MYCCL|nr:serine/threonine protein phosphatase 2C [Mycena chlorophos]